MLFSLKKNIMLCLPGAARHSGSGSKEAVCVRKNGLGDLAAPRVRGGACVRQRDVELHVLLAARSSMLLPPLVIGSDRKPHVIQLHSTASSMPLSTTASPSVGCS